MTTYRDSGDFRGASFIDVDMSRAAFREVDLSNTRMRGVVLFDADIDGAINGLRLNGVEVAPLVAAELDRLHPERTKLRPSTPEGMREAWTVIESFWTPTMGRARALSEPDLHRSVDDEWSFTQTLRHLVFVIDSWFGHAVLGRSTRFHPLALPASFTNDTDAAEYGVDVTAQPTFAEVVEAREQAMAEVKVFLDGVTQADLDRVRAPNLSPGFPQPAERTAVECLHVVFNEEWTHHQFAVRDLTVIEGGAPAPG